MADVQLGTAQVNITPPLGISLMGSFEDRRATNVHDDLFVKTLVIGSDDVKLAVVVCDLIVIERGDTDAAKALIQEECGMPPECVMIAATHTHTGPTTAAALGARRDDDYMAGVRRKIADAVRLAHNRMEPVEWGHSVGHEDRLVSSRRLRMKHGGVQMNPGASNPNIVEPGRAGSGRNDGRKRPAAA